MKTKQNNASVKDFISSVKNERRRKDSLVVLKMMKDATGKRAKMWGPSIIGFDKSHYKYADGRDGEICMIGFSPRVQALTFYMSTKFKNGEKLLKKLGKHKMGPGGCLYINKLHDVDLAVLERIISESYRYKKETQA
jgi:Domain of unknown function (DU1801)